MKTYLGAGAMKVLIVAKTRQGSGACIGGITFEGQSVRLIAADAAMIDRFDPVILDPSGLSRTKSRSFPAARDYGDLAGLAPDPLGQPPASG